MSETEQPITGHDMSRFWRLVNNDGGLITGTWWVTRPDDRKGEQHIKPVDVTMWSEGRHHGLHLDDAFTAFVANGEVKPIQVRSRHEHVQNEAEHRLSEIESVVLAVAAAVDWEAAR
jgi:hypothetical protein